MTNPYSSNLRLVSPTQKKGENFERLACQYLKSQGLELVSQNWLKPKVGELDLVMIENGQIWQTLVFVEVRVRKSSDYGDALLSITPVKQKKLIKTAQYFLQAHPQYHDYDCRFDVLAYETKSNDTRFNIQSTQDFASNQTTNTSIQDDNPVYHPEWVKGAFLTSNFI